VRRDAALKSKMAPAAAALAQYFADAIQGAAAAAGLAAAPAAAVPSAAQGPCHPTTPACTPIPQICGHTPVLPCATLNPPCPPHPGYPSCIPVCAAPTSLATCSAVICGPSPLAGCTAADPIIQRIESFHCLRGRLLAEHRSRGYTLYRASAGAPVARLRPIGRADRVEVLYWSLWSETWKKVGPFGRTVLPLDEALQFIVSEDIF
jgi:hypothetical protein